MTATVAPLVVIPSPEAVAFLPAFANGGWTDGQGRNLPEFLAFHMGAAEARRLLDAADRLRTGEAVPVDELVKHPVPDCEALTWLAGGTFHDPIPMRQVTVCGLHVPAGATFTPAAGRPCGQCFEVAS